MVLGHYLWETMKEVQETMQSTPFFSFLIFLSFLLILYKLMITRSAVPKLNLPPSPPKLPIIGNIHQLGSLPHRSLRALAGKYGPDLMLLQLGGNPTLIVSSVEAAKEIFKSTTNDVVLSNRPRTTAAKIFLYGCADVAFSPYGEYWRQAKKICVLELLTFKRVQSFQFVREEEGANLIDRIRGACLCGDSVNLTEMLLAVTSSIVSRSVLGRNAEEGGGGGGRSKCGALIRKFMKQFTAFSIGDLFRSLEWMDYVTGLIPQLRSTAKELDDLFDQAVEEHKHTPGSAKKDFVDILLQLQKSSNLDIPITQDNIKAILLDMFVAGTETSSTTMEWLMAELVRNPSIMKKSQEEVRGIVGKQSKVEMDDVDKMSYLKCVVKESLRLHPPFPLLLPRIAYASLELGGYHIPAKTTVIVNAFAIQTDPKLWDRPEEFLPERFENSTIDFQGQDFQFIPFGGGRRICPGASFAVASITYLVANLLYWFDWKLPADTARQDLDMTEAFGITVSKKNPLCLVPTLYSC